MDNPPSVQGRGNLSATSFPSTMGDQRDPNRGLMGGEAASDAWRQGLYITQMRRMSPKALPHTLK